VPSPPAGPVGSLRDDSELSSSVVPKAKLPTSRPHHLHAASPGSSRHSASPNGVAQGEHAQGRMATNDSADFSMVSSASLATTAMERQHFDRRQLIEWGENLCEEVHSLEQLNAEFERKLTEAQADKGRLEGDLEQMRRHCAELERVVHQQGSSRPSPRDGVSSLSENGELRKQLAAYAVEIDVLREERESGQQSLRDAQEAVQRLNIERDELLRSLQEVERSHHEKSHHCERLESLLNMTQHEKNAMEGRLHNASSELGVVGASLQMAQEQGSDSQRHAEEVAAQAERLSSGKDETIAALIDIIQPLRDQLHGLQESFVKQTREYGQFVQKVRQKQQNAVNEICVMGRSLSSQVQDVHELPQQLEELVRISQGVELGQQRSMGELQRTYKDLQTEFDRVQEQSRVAADQHQRLLKDVDMRDAEEASRQQMKTERFKYMNNPAITVQMRIACHEGVIVEKVNDKTNRKEYRKVIICQDTMRLKWVKHPFKFGKGESVVELDRVILIGFGCMTRASQLFPNLQPWHCFSVYTTERSYDFICRQTDETEAFVLSISRLCARLSGWAVPGSIQSHSRFLAATGWSKVENTCRKERKTLCAALMDAMQQAAAAGAAGISPVAAMPATPTSAMAIPGAGGASPMATPMLGFARPALPRPQSPGAAHVAAATPTLASPRSLMRPAISQ